MTDVIEVAVTAIYLSKRYLLAEKATPGKIMLSDGGQVETMGEIADFAEVQERWYVDRGHEGKGCPGVYAYEFTEPMGAWLYEQYGLPTTEEFIAELDRRWAEWVGPRFRYEVQPCIDEGETRSPVPSLRQPTGASTSERSTAQNPVVPSGLQTSRAVRMRWCSETF